MSCFGYSSSLFDLFGNINACHVSNADNGLAVFKYMQGADSVLLVKKEDYEICNTQNPIKRMDDGNSTFFFDRWGSFFFISGRPESCWTGQKLWVVVMAIRKPIPSPSPSPSTTYPSPPSLSPNSDKGPPSPASTSSSPAILTDVVSLSLVFMLSTSAFFLEKLQN